MNFFKRIFKWFALCGVCKKFLTKDDVCHYFICEKCKYYLPHDRTYDFQIISLDSGQEFRVYRVLDEQRTEFQICSGALWKHIATIPKIIPYKNIKEKIEKMIILK
jgi:hypothetical protein